MKWVFSIFLMSGVCLHAAPITNLYNTGVLEHGSLLGPNEIDSHYRITASADAGVPGPDAFTLQPGFPVGPWLPEGPNSRWIAPQADQSGGNSPGSYTFATSFDLAGGDPATAQISGQMSADNSVTAVRLNETDLGITAGGFNVWTVFSIPRGAPFVARTNTLEFDVNNAEPGVNPTGFRVEMIGRATGLSEAPTIAAQPANQEVLVGGSATFSLDADGTPPLSYQWRFKGNPVTGANTASYTISAATTNDAGNYSVVITNAFGQVTSTNAMLIVLVPFPGIYDSGVDDNRAVLADSSMDTHYRLVVNPNDPASPQTLVQDSTVFPIVSGPWIANSSKSKWIGPFNETSAAAGGNYSYELLLNLTGYNPASGYLAGSWATDDGGSLFLNGADTGFRSGGFGGFSVFTLTNGFVSGTNRLEFRVNNGGVGYTGLRVENLRGTAEEQAVMVLPPRIVTQPRGLTRVITDSASFTVVADGTQPLSYQWLRNGTNLSGQTTPTFAVTRLLPGDEGDYSVRVSNALGSTNSAVATLNLIVPHVGVFNTGVDSTGNVISLGEADPHYVLLSSADATYAGPSAYPPTSAPIPPWVANDADSQWISPRPDGTDAAPGAYTYRLIFQLSAADVATAAITASVATDDGNGGIRLNGIPVEFGASGFGGFTELVISDGSPFVAGYNTLDFIPVNGGTSANPTGLRVDNIVLAGVTAAPTLAVARSGANVRIAWPVATDGFVLQETSALPGGWTASGGPQSIEGNENVALAPVTDSAKFFRLIKN